MKKAVFLAVMLMGIMAERGLAEQPVHFRDKNLEEAVEETLGVSDPTPSNMLLLTALSAEWSNIMDIAGLEYAKNLGYLGLSFNHITDISALSALTKLKSLYLDVNVELSNISALSGLTNLTQLGLQDTDVSDISALSRLTNLQVLGLSSTKFADCSALSNLTRLTMLDLSYCYMVRDISPLGKLTNLTVLDLDGCFISDFSPVSRLESLTSLSLGNYYTTDISAISGLTKLTDLVIISTQVRDISALSGKANLARLQLQNNLISDISALAGLMRLKYLDLRGNPLNQDACKIHIPQILKNNPGVKLYFDQCAPQAAAALIGLEVTQAVQDLINSVPLIEGKTTYVRAHICSKSSQPVRIAAQLKGFRGGSELTGSPLKAINPDAALIAKPKSLARRANLSDSLNFRLPPQWLSGAVELHLVAEANDIEYRDPAEPDGEPNDGVVRLAFEPAAELEVKLVAVRWTDASGAVHSPTLQDLFELAMRLRAAYPISRINWSHGLLNVPWSVAPDVRAVTLLLGAVRVNDGCTDSAACRRLYYGVVVDGSENQTKGIAVDISKPVASGYMSADPWDWTRNLHAHELGHCFGLYHPVHSRYTPPGPTRDKLGPCGEQAPASEPDFPYVYMINEHDRVTIGPMDLGEQQLIYGLDTHGMEVADPREHFELMSYCGEKSGQWQWVSDITYKRLLNSINNTFGSSAGGQTGPANAGRQDYLLVRGRVDFDTDSVEFLPFVLVSNLWVPPEPSPGDYSLELLDGANQPVVTISFEPDRFIPGWPVEDSAIGCFIIAVRADPNIRRAAVYHNGTLLTTTAASANAPAVRVVSPNGGEILDQQQVVLRWSGNDRDTDTLTYTVQYSWDGGCTWETLAVDWPDTEYQIDRSLLRQTRNGLIRVTASDGFNTAVDQSDAEFTVPNNAPELFIVAPKTEALFTGKQAVFFEAVAQDREDNQVSASNLQWVSSLDGSLGTGDVFNLGADELSEGKHSITVTATDSGGLSSSKSVKINVFRVSCDLNLDGVVDLGDYAVFSEQWLGPPAVPSADIAPDSKDGVVDFRDLSILAEHWLEGAGP